LSWSGLFEDPIPLIARGDRILRLATVRKPFNHRTNTSNESKIVLAHILVNLRYEVERRS
jgi:hypothetical protein